MCWLSWNLGASTSWNPQGLPWPVMGLLCFWYMSTLLLLEQVLHDLQYIQCFFTLVERDLFRVNRAIFCIHLGVVFLLPWGRPLLWEETCISEFLGNILRTINVLWIARLYFYVFSWFTHRMTSPYIYFILISLTLAFYFSWIRKYSICVVNGDRCVYLFVLLVMLVLAKSVPKKWMTELLIGATECYE